jgi:adenosylcobinamide-GDP ribazoletransferase
MLDRSWQAFLAAVQFLTRLPVPGGMNGPGANVSLLRAAVVFFPLVGGLIGLLTGSAIRLAMLAWPAEPAVLLGLAFEALLTGAFHEDAVADCCDGLGGGRTREDVLRIMKDSRVGSFGALGLLLAVLLRASCLLALEPDRLLPAVIASAGLGRWAVLVVMAAVPPIPEREGLGRDVGSRVGGRQLMLGSLFLSPALAWASVIEPVRLACGAGAAFLFALGWGEYVRRRLGGVTGDCLGLACYAGQLAVLLALVARV